MNVIDVPFVRANGDFSLREVFAEGACNENLSGTPAERLMMLKFLSALCLAACRPQTRKEIETLTNDDLARRVREYLASRQELFEFEGDHPFLQYPVAVKAKEKKCPLISEFIPGYPSANRGILRKCELMPHPSDADRVRALLFSVIMPFAGKKTDKTVWISPSGSGTKETYSSPSVGPVGLVHSFVLGQTLLDTLRLNLMSEEDLRGTCFTAGLGRAPWEEMPLENDKVAVRLKKTLMGRLLPMLRFVLIEADKLHATYGVAPDADVEEPSATCWTDSKGERKRARFLSPGYWLGLAAVFGYNRDEDPLPPSLQLKVCLPGALRDPSYVGVELLGVRTSWNSGEQSFGTGDEMFRFFVPVTSQKEFLNQKFNFMLRLQKALFVSFKELWICKRVSSIDEKQELNNLGQKFVNAHVELVLSDLMKDFGELLSLTCEEESAAFEHEMVRKARQMLDQLIRTSGTKAMSMVGRIDLNPNSIFDNHQVKENNDEA